MHINSDNPLLFLQLSYFISSLPLAESSVFLLEVKAGKRSHISIMEEKASPACMPFSSSPQNGTSQLGWRRHGRELRAVVPGDDRWLHTLRSTQSTLAFKYGLYEELGDL